MTEPTAPGPDPVPGGDEAQAGAAGRAQEWLAQLQKMIEGVAREAAPTVREVAAKAAELTAVAAEKTGPLAQRAAHATEEGSSKLAERAHRLADDLRREMADAEAAAEGAPGPAADETPSEESPSA
ncbi:MAG: hypothetical protein MUC54_00910 [Chloroflexi bacterium]|jgi:hypothetical protein|nr:hypothetical protein [Chloroflexota bacterium]